MDDSRREENDPARACGHDPCGTFKRPIAPLDRISFGT
jgi:hypothetical protein